MNLLKHPGLLRLVLFSMLAAGLFFILQAEIDNGSKGKSILSPGAIAPEEEEGGLPSIVPSDGKPTKIEYRNIIFRRDGSHKTFGPAAAPGAESPEL
ncbi:MAG TPA: hypothetical protein VEF34_08675 [Syntrophobacteraceae bacterium]|nr:hypothetical protein [Syntrophobacteraceae bacterium]